ncbi:MAG: hypothetical protein JHC93_01015 [Parachlamydiales bacterium]|nr:hypothetical protein [Parachlamydiales bacterium]
MYSLNPLKAILALKNYASYYIPPTKTQSDSSSKSGLDDDFVMLEKSPSSTSIDEHLKHDEKADQLIGSDPISIKDFELVANDMECNINIKRGIDCHPVVNIDERSLDLKHETMLANLGKLNNYPREVIRNFIYHNAFKFSVKLSKIKKAYKDISEPNRKFFPNCEKILNEEVRINRDAIKPKITSIKSISEKQNFGLRNRRGLAERSRIFEDRINENKRDQDRNKTEEFKIKVIFNKFREKFLCCSLQDSNPDSTEINFQFCVLGSPHIYKKSIPISALNPPRIHTKVKL